MKSIENKDTQERPNKVFHEATHIITEEPSMFKDTKKFQNKLKDFLQTVLKIFFQTNNFF